MYKFILIGTVFVLLGLYMEWWSVYKTFLLDDPNTKTTTIECILGGLTLIIGLIIAFGD
jgi:hypothetical protein